MFDKPQAPARPEAVLQRRGVERVQAILNAAEELLTEQGYQAATLKAIGERAGIPTASVYHYFADRHQVDAELLKRHIRGMDEQVNAALDDPGPSSLRDGVDAVIDAMLHYFRQHPATVQLWFAGRHEQLVDLVAVFHQSKAEQLWTVLIEQRLLPAGTPLVVLQVAFEAGSRLFDVAFQRSATGDDAVIDEARRLVTAYLATYAA